MHYESPVIFGLGWVTARKQGWRVHGGDKQGQLPLFGLGRVTVAGGAKWRLWAAGAPTQPSPVLGC